MACAVQEAQWESTPNWPTRKAGRGERFWIATELVGKSIQNACQVHDARFCIACRPRRRARTIGLGIEQANRLDDGSHSRRTSLQHPPPRARPPASRLANPAVGPLPLPSGAQGARTVTRMAGILNHAILFWVQDNGSEAAGRRRSVTVELPSLRNYRIPRRSLGWPGSGRPLSTKQQISGGQP